MTVVGGEVVGGAVTTGAGRVVTGAPGGAVGVGLVGLVGLGAVGATEAGAPGAPPGPVPAGPGGGTAGATRVGVVLEGPGPAALVPTEVTGAPPVAPIVAAWPVGVPAATEPWATLPDGAVVVRNDVDVEAA